MGSFFAGIKAGTLSGIVYVGGLALFNVAVLYAFKPETITALSTTFSQYCTNSTATGGVITGTPQDCFDTIVTISIPTVAFLGLFVSLFFSGILGTSYERIPGKSRVIKGELMAVIVGFCLLLIGLSGAYFTYNTAIIMNVFFVGWTAVFGFLLGRLYTRYTRTVNFQSQDPSLLKIMVDGKDRTGRESTFATTSTHRLKAQVAEDASFKGWQAVGEITLEDTRSFETTMEVKGNGALNALVGKKY